MSKLAMSWASRQRIADNCMRSVLGVLAYMHRDGADLFPSQNYIAEQVGATERSVRSALRLLQHFGLLQRRARSAGARGRISDLITLCIDEADVTVTRKMVAAARKGLSKSSSNRKSLPVAGKSQPEKSAVATGKSFRGIEGYQKEEPRQEGNISELGIGNTRKATGGLRVITGGRR